MRALLFASVFTLGPTALPPPAPAVGDPAEEAAPAEHAWLAEGQRVLLYGQGSYLQALEAFKQPITLHVMDSTRLDPLARIPGRDSVVRDKSEGRAPKKRIKKAFASETLSYAPTLSPLPNAWAILARHKTSARVTVHYEGDPLHQSAGRAPGLALPVIGPIDLGVAWLPGHMMSFEPEIKLSFRRGAFRPTLGAGVPIFMWDTTRYGISGVGGFEWLMTRDLRFFAQVGAVRYASVPTAYARSQVVPALGLTGHL